jgi:hypothetical protein
MSAPFEGKDVLEDVVQVGEWLPSVVFLSVVLPLN